MNMGPDQRPAVKSRPRSNKGCFGEKSMKHESERAVSPVIGVVLMVAITVILAAVIGAMMTGMIDDGFGGSSHADVSIDGDNSNEVVVTLESTSTADGIYVQNESGLEAWNTTSVGSSVTLNDGYDGETVDDVDLTNDEHRFSVVAFSIDSDGERTGENTVATFQYDPNA